MHRAGCQRLEFGVESGSQRVLDLMEKGTKVSTIKNVLQNCYEAGISTQIYILIGFPGETEEDYQKTWSLLEDVKNYVDTVGYMSFDLGKFSKVAVEKEKFGITRIYDNPPGQELLSGYSSFEVERGFSQREASEIVDSLYSSGPGVNTSEGTYFYTLPEWHNLLYIKYHNIRALREILNNSGDEDIISQNSRIGIAQIQSTQTIKINDNWVKSPFDLEKIDSLINQISFEATELERDKGMDLTTAFSVCFARVQPLNKEERYYAYTKINSSMIEIPKFIAEHCLKPVKYEQLLNHLTNVTNYSKDELSRYLSQLYGLGGLVSADDDL
jgi:hypothetical protein